MADDKSDKITIPKGYKLTTCFEYNSTNKHQRPNHFWKVTDPMQLVSMSYTATFVKDVYVKKDGKAKSKYSDLFTKPADLEKVQRQRGYEEFKARKEERESKKKVEYSSSSESETEEERRRAKRRRERKRAERERAEDTRDDRRRNKDRDSKDKKNRKDR